MMQCNKTGLTSKDWKTILDVLNMYDPNDVIRICPEMGTPEFVQGVNTAFKKVLKYVESDSFKDSFLVDTVTDSTMYKMRQQMIDEQYLHSLS